jgi:hypothetical protein
VRVLDTRASVLGDALAVLDAGERKVLTALVEKMLAAVTTDAAHAEQICRLCDVGACPPARALSGLCASLREFLSSSASLRLWLLLAYFTNRFGALIEPVFFLTFSEMLITVVFEPADRISAPAVGWARSSH